MRGKGEGSVYQRKDGMWAAVVELPPRDGKRRRKSVYGKTKTAVLAKMRSEQKILETHGDIHSSGMTVGQFMNYWLTEIVAKTRRPRTADSYRSIVRTYIAPCIGTIRLDKLTAVHVRKLQSFVLDDLGKSSTTARNAHGVLSAAMLDALREGRINANPCAVVKAPPRAATSLDTLATDEVREFFKNNRGNPDMYLWATYLLTANRRGEVIGLEWDRVEGGVLDLSWQLQRIPKGQPIPADYEARPLSGGLYLTRPKTKSGWRVIPLVPPLSTMLAEWRAMAPENPWGLVFTRVAERGARKGKPIPLDPDYISRAWAEFAAKQWPHKHVRLHDLRHTAVDLLLEAGVPEDVIVEICGWSARAMVQHYKSKEKLMRRTAAMQAFSTHLGIDS